MFRKSDGASGAALVTVLSYDGVQLALPDLINGNCIFSYLQAVLQPTLVETLGRLRLQKSGLESADWTWIGARTGTGTIR